MRLIWRFLPVLLLALPTAVAAAPRDAAPFLVLEKEALLITPPRQVTTGMVSQAEWSPDGKYVLAFSSELPYPFRLPVNAPPNVRTALVLWNASTGDGKDVWSASRTVEGTPQFAWFSRGEAAAVLLDLERPIPPAERKGGPALRLERWLYRLDARRGVMKPLQRVGEGTNLTASPTFPGLLMWEFGPGTLRVVRADGAIVNLPLPPSSSLGGAQWLAGGRRAWVGLTTAPDAKKPRHLVADLETGKLEVLEARPQGFATAEAQHPISVVGGEGSVGGPGSPRIRPLWLETREKSEQPRALLAADAEWGKLSPAGDAVLYADDRGAWVMRPVRVPKEMFFQARAAALRAQVLTSGKQLGMALHMYAADHNDHFPGGDVSVIAALQPYLKNDQLFQGFTYTYGGGPIAEIGKPAAVPLGHVAGPGGRAVIFADGHVVWEPERR